MYDSSKNEIDDLNKALNIFNDFKRFDFLCEKVINEWYISCEENLSNKHINRVAWIGQAALNILDFIPERVTKKAWKFLSSENKNKLNKIAYLKILKYENANKKLYKKMGESLF